MASNLLSLSVELTREVMKYLFGYMHTIHIAHGQDHEYSLGSIIEADKEPDIEKLEPSILRVCSELRASGLDILYGCHCFEFMDPAALQWFVTHSDTSRIRHVRFLLDSDVTELKAWLAYWGTGELKTAFPKLQKVEVDTTFVPLTGERKRWIDIRLDVACGMLQKGLPRRCKVVKKYASSHYDPI
ncbi:hypothetical protein MMC18_001300 [Xylographa bjoerkii]|nr:hypothetical protein [Xylographa bjoerkii]